MVAILSRDPELYSTQVLVETFENSGHEVRVLDSLSLEVKVGHGVFQNGKKLEPSLIFPRFSSQILVAGLAVIREWEREKRSIINGSKSLMLAHDQLATLQALSSASLAIPETSFCSQPHNEATYTSLLGNSPKVIKLLEASQGKGVNLAPDKIIGKSLLSTLAYLRSSGITQEFLEEAKGSDIRILIFKGQVIGAIKRTSNSEDFRANLHQGGTMEEYSPSEEEKSIAILATKTLGLDFAGVDLIQSERGKLVLEVNASPGLEGVDLGDRGRTTRLIQSHLPQVHA